MIINSCTELYIGDECIPLVGVDMVEWRSKRAATVILTGIFEKSLSLFDKLKEGINLEVLMFCSGMKRCQDKSTGRLIMVFKDIWDIEKWIEYPIALHIEEVQQLEIKAIFNCALELFDDDEASG